MSILPASHRVLAAVERNDLTARVRDRQQIGEIEGMRHILQRRKDRTLPFAGAFAHVFFTISIFRCAFHADGGTAGIPHA